MTGDKLKSTWPVFYADSLIEDSIVIDRQLQERVEIRSGKLREETKSDEKAQLTRSKRAF